MFKTILLCLVLFLFFLGTQSGHLIRKTKRITQRVHGSVEEPNTKHSHCHLERHFICLAKPKFVHILAGPLLPHQYQQLCPLRLLAFRSQFLPQHLQHQSLLRLLERPRRLFRVLLLLQRPHHHHRKFNHPPRQHLPLRLRQLPLSVFPECRRPQQRRL